MPFLTQPSSTLSGLGTGTGSALSCATPVAGVSSLAGNCTWVTADRILSKEITRGSGGVPEARFGSGCSPPESDYNRQDDLT
ncbi:hypothetical protein PGIGA_G00184810 [Pangasianodon gigas]|uniref:Uncharacterized protein n=1 Tax=Pangasianodon gigas TaxID=30993 RepID=A0ACC5WB76_PANGG|nr:hypothetical protein [Pangasianodon gigas]